MAMITMIEYAKRHHKNARYLRTKCGNSGFKTAQKVGRDWFIDEDEPCADNRVTDGKWVGYVRAKNRGKTEPWMNDYCVQYLLSQFGEQKEIHVSAKTRPDAYEKAVYEEIPRVEGESPYSAWVYSVSYKNGNTRVLKPDEDIK